MEKSTLRLSAIFNDGMVLQRRCENKIYGTESAEISEVTVNFAGEVYRADVERDGQFTVILPAMEAGGPYTLEICASEKKTIHDVWIGEVFLLSGQSNMELPVRRTLDVTAEEIAQTNLSQVRQFLVPMSIRSFCEPQSMLPEGKWVNADAQHIMDFSGVGLFFAKEIHTLEGVTIGLVMTAVGGSSVEAWMDIQTLRQFGKYEDKIKDFYDLGQFEEYLAGQERAAAAWRKQIADDDFVVTNEIPEGLEVMQVPTMVSELDWKNFHGSLIFYRELELQTYDEAEAYIYLGAIIESDEVWMNGKRVGGTEYRYPPRKYPIPAGVLHKGKNIITVRIEIEDINGGFVKGMPYYFYDGYEQHPLSGNWQYRVGHTISVRKPEVLFPPTLPVGLYYSSLTPLKNISFRAVLWYQGESNDKNPEEYSVLFEAMTRIWRTLFGWEIPFFTVQLSAFLDPVFAYSSGGHRDSGWARVRDEQRRCTQIPSVYLVPSMDVGEPADLHPQDKKSVGIRLANAVKKELYGVETHYEMVVPESAVREGNRLRVKFLHIKQTTPKAISGFGFMRTGGQSGTGKVVAAEAVLEGDTVEIVIPEEFCGMQSFQLVYHWEDCPERFDLMNEYGVISGSFLLNEKEIVFC